MKTKKRILLVSHYSGNPGGPVDKFYDFLKGNYTINQILYPLWPGNKQPIYVKTSQGKFTFNLPPALQFISEGVATTFMLKRNKKSIQNIDLAICFDSLSFINIYLFNLFYKSKKLVFYNIDYSQKRFENPVLNFIYQKCNAFAYKKCDYFFSLYQSLVEDIDPEQKLTQKSYVIKATVDLRHINRRKKVKPNSLVYAGTLEYGTVDFNPMLKALAKLKKEHIPFTLDLYGKIGEKSALRDTVTALKLDDRVIFKGTVENEVLVNEVLPGYKIGLAPYVTKGTKGAPDHAFTGTDLTAKLVDYLGAGLPMITVELNDGFSVLTKNKCGYLVVTENEWYKALKTLLTNERVYKEYKKNSLRVGKDYDVEEVFGTVLKKIFSE